MNKKKEVSSASRVDRPFSSRHAGSVVKRRQLWSGDEPRPTKLEAAIQPHQWVNAPTRQGGYVSNLVSPGSSLISEPRQCETELRGAHFPKHTKSTTPSQTSSPPSPPPAPPSLNSGGEEGSYSRLRDFCITQL